MQFVILNTSAPFSQQGSLSTLRFCQAVLAQGEHTLLVFFYGQGVLNALPCEHEESTLNVPKGWQDLQGNGVDLQLCHIAAENRGVTKTNALSGFSFSSLAQLMQAIQHADRVITFGA